MSKHLLDLIFLLDLTMQITLKLMLLSILVKPVDLMTTLSLKKIIAVLFSLTHVNTNKEDTILVLEELPKHSHQKINTSTYLLSIKLNHSKPQSTSRKYNSLNVYTLSLTLLLGPLYRLNLPLI